MSIVAILAIMAGALIINIMFNLSRISEHIARQPVGAEKKPSFKKISWAFVASFPIIFLLLMGGDKLTSVQKEQHLRQAANSLVKEYPEIINELCNYRFDTLYLQQAAHYLTLLEKTDRNFPSINLIVIDSIASEQVFLDIKQYMYLPENQKFTKTDFLYASSTEERNYLQSVFGSQNNEVRYTAHDGSYEMFFPIQHQGKIIVLYFTQYQAYGKIGS